MKKILSAAAAAAVLAGAIVTTIPERAPSGPALSADPWSPVLIREPKYGPREAKTSPREARKQPREARKAGDSA